MAIKPKTKALRHRRQAPAGRTKAEGAQARRGRLGKVRKEFWLDPELLQVAKEYIGAATERETVELALDLVAFRRELVVGVVALRGLPLNDVE